MVLVSNCVDCVKRVYPEWSRTPNTDRDDATAADEAATTPAGTLTD
jgi:hypothetical protein